VTWSLTGVGGKAVQDGADRGCGAQAGGSWEWRLPDSFRMEHQGLQDELYVGGVYVRFFLKDPHFPLRDPKAFLEVGHGIRVHFRAGPGCLKRVGFAGRISAIRVVHAFRRRRGGVRLRGRLGGQGRSAAHTRVLTRAGSRLRCRNQPLASPSHVLPRAGACLELTALPRSPGGLQGLLKAYMAEVASSPASPALAVLLAAAAVELLRGHTLLADSSVQLGHPDQLIRLLAAHLPSALGEERGIRGNRQTDRQGCKALRAFVPLGCTMWTHCFGLGPKPHSHSPLAWCFIRSPLLAGACLSSRQWFRWEPLFFVDWLAGI
jgi:hypothetical protein